MQIAAIITVEEKLLKAMKESNLTILDSLLHDELLFNIPNGQSIDKAMDLEHYQSGQMNITMIESEDQKIHMIGDTAVVVASIRMKGFFLTQPLDGKYRINRVWKCIDNQWKVISGSSIAML